MHLKRLIKFSMLIYILLTSLITSGTLVITIPLVSPINIHIVLKYRISTSYIISSITEEGTLAQVSTLIMVPLITTYFSRPLPIKMRIIYIASVLFITYSVFLVIITLIGTVGTLRINSLINLLIYNIITNT